MNKKGTIAFYIGSLARGGAERVMINLVTHFHTVGYTVYLVTKTTDEPEYDVPQGVTRMIADITAEEETDSRIKNLRNRIKKLKGIWEDIKPDIIVSFIRKNNLMAIASAKGLNIPVIVGIRSNPARELQGRFFKRLSFFMFRYADGIVVQTNRGKEYFPGGLRKKIVVMPNSLSEEFVGQDYEENRLSQVVTVGRIDQNKNQRMLLEAFEDIMGNYPDWSLHLYGDGEMAAGLRNRFDSARIVFHGPVTDVRDRIKKASIFVLPSKQEGMPNALIEAMALGLAPISTDCPCGGPADLIEDGENGLLIPVDDKEALKTALGKLMEDEALIRSMGQKAMEIQTRLEPAVVNKMWQEYIESIMLKRSSK